MLDEDVGLHLRPTLMKEAGSVRARVVLCWAEMDQSRTIVVTYQMLRTQYPIRKKKYGPIWLCSISKDRDFRLVCKFNIEAWSDA